MVSSPRWPLVLVLVTLATLAAGAGVVGWVQRQRAAQPEYQIKRGNAAIEAKNWKQVESIANRLELDGFHDEASYLRAKVYYARGKEYATQDDLIKAIEMLKRVRDNETIGTEARLLEGNCYTDIGDFLQAEHAFATVAARAPDNPAAHWGLAVIYFNIRAWDDSFHECREVARLDDADGRPHGHMGLMYKELKQYKDAAAAYRDALARQLSNSRREEIRWELAEVLLELKGKANVAEAVQLLDEISDEGRGTLRQSAIEAEILWQKGDQQAAVARLREAMAAQRRGANQDSLLMARLWIRLCRYMREAGQPATALPLLEQIKDRFQWDAEFAELLLNVYKDLKKENSLPVQQLHLERALEIQEEIQQLERKAHKDRTDRDSRARLSKLYERFGQRELAAIWEMAAVSALP